MILVSDSHPTEEEVLHFVGQLKTLRSNEVLSKKKAIKTYKAQQDLVNNYSYTKEDIEKSIQEKKKKNKFVNIGKERTIISLEVKAARNDLEEAKLKLEQEKKRLESKTLSGDEEDLLTQKIQKIEEDLDNAQTVYDQKLVEEKNIIEADNRIKRKLKSTKNIQNLSRVNQKAYSKNKRADYDAYKNLKNKEVEQSLDPYARRKVKPKNLWEVGQTRKTEKEENVSKAADNPVITPSADEKIKKAVGNAYEKEKKTEDPITSQKTDLSFQTHQFAIDEELLGKGTNMFLGATKKAPKRQRVRKGISLVQYQERKIAGTL